MERLTYKANGIVHSKALTNTEILNRLAELEDKIESGKLIELPCKAIYGRDLCVTIYISEDGSICITNPYRQ